MDTAERVKRFMMQFLNKRNQKHLNEIVWMVFVLVVKVVVTTGYNKMNEKPLTPKRNKKVRV